MPIHTLTQPVVTPFDPTALNAAIQTLRDNEAADDATVEALDKIVKAITVPDIKPLSDRITALEGKTSPAQVIKVASPPPDGSWILSLQVQKDWTTKKQTTRLWAQIEQGLAKPLIVLEDALTTPTHLTAIAQPDESFQNAINELKLSYRTTLTLQNEASMTMQFPAGLITRVDLEGQDVQGTALELGGQAIAPTAISLNLNPFMGNGLITQILWKFIFTDGNRLDYLVPIVR